MDASQLPRRRHEIGPKIRLLHWTRQQAQFKLGAVGFTPEQLKTELDWIDEHIGDLPYAVDIVIPQKYAGIGETDPKKLEAMLESQVPQGHRDFAAKLLADHGVPEAPPEDKLGLLGWTEATAKPLVEEALRRPKVKMIANAS